MHISNNLRCNCLRKSIVKMRQILWVWLLVMMTFASVNIERYRCCLEEERSGLLEIKAWINHPNGNYLRDWVETTEDTDCCKWSGVKCDNTTNRVTELHLLLERESWILENTEDTNLYLNASLFLPIKELKSLGLHSRRLVGCLENQGFEVLASRLKKLEELYLCSCAFNDSIYSSLLTLSSLKILDLSRNKLTTISANINGLRELEELYIGANIFNDSILTSLNGFSSLKTLDLSNTMNLTGFVGINGLRNLKSLYLNGIDIKGSVLIESLGALPSLKTFSAAWSNLTGALFSEGFYNLTSLEELFLDNSHLPTNFLLNMGELSTLKVLSLQGCDLNGPFSAQGLRKLETLYLDGIDIKGSFVIESLGALPSLKTFSATQSNLTKTLFGEGFYNSTSLEELFLDNSYLPTNFLLNLEALSTLKVLSLKGCDLNGTLPTQGWCEMKNLQQLDLSSNKLEGLLPPCLRNLSSLQLLDVSYNHLVGNIGSSALTSLTSLKYLDLLDNGFEVPISFRSFVNHSNLKFLSCDHNKPITEPLFQSIIPKFQLKFFSFSNCTSKLVEIPNFLHNQYDLRVLDLSYNNFRGRFPSWLFENNTRLEQLLLRDNFFKGPLQFQYHPNPYLLAIDIANNNIYGQIPRNICSIFPNLRDLRMAKNELEGATPTCFGNMSTLGVLDLCNNAFSTIKLEQLTSLSFLGLSNNNLEGHISPALFNSSSLQDLYLNGNNLTGQVWDISSINGLSLEALDISDNRLSGMLPKWIGKMSNLQAIDLSKNHFKGPIPREFCNLYSLQYFDLSENNLSGSIPSCFNPTQITHIHLSKNQLSGPLTSSFFNISTLVALELSNNSFTGPIPNWIGNLSRLSVLVIKANAFGGELPIQLCMLQQLSILDVSNNKLSGPLPSCFGNLTFKAASDKGYVSPTLFAYRSFNKSNFVSMGLTNLDDYYTFGNQNPTIIGNEVVEFTTKRHSYIYEGDILNFMSGMDLSCNRFSGHIPSELGQLDGLHALNLSHNNFSGSLPATFSKLNQIESLDLSHNSLTGIIPPQLTEITTLEVFSVAYNNLSGSTPERKNQFGTFDESSYEGNPLLCGPPLQTNCSKEESPLQSRPNDEEEDDDSIDMDVFYASFLVCYIIVVLTIAVVLYINPHWRRKWFDFIEECIDTCYYFVVDSFHNCPA